MMQFPTGVMSSTVQERAAEVLPPSPYGDGAPYPDPNDYMLIAIYDTTTGEIRQVNRVVLQDMHRQHAAWPGCEYVEVPEGIKPSTHEIDLKTMTAVVRTTPTQAQVGKKVAELWQASRVDSFQSSGKIYQINQDSILKMSAAAVVGGVIEADGVPVVHTPEQAKQVLTDYMTLGASNEAKFSVLKLSAAEASTKDELDAITWS